MVIKRENGKEVYTEQMRKMLQKQEDTLLPSNWQGIGSVSVTRSGISDSLRAHVL